MAYKIVSLDISAQEPMINTFLSREPRWMEIFRNRTLRELGLLDYLDILFQEALNLDPNSIQASSYWAWVDKRFHRNYGPLVRFNFLTDQIRKLRSSPKLCEIFGSEIQSLERVLKEMSVGFLHDYKNFMGGNQ